MKFQRYFLLFFLFLCFQCSIFSQFSIDGIIRPRTEFRQGYKRPLIDTLKPAFVTFQRTLINFAYKSNKFSTDISIQDYRIWGQSETKESNSKLEIFEAWAEYLIDPAFSIKFGRQCIQYDDNRLFANGEWNSGNAHDLLLLKYKSKENFETHFALAYNNSTDSLMNDYYTVKKFYRTMGYLWIGKTFPNKLKLSAIGVLEGLQKSDNYSVTYPRFTGGANIYLLDDSTRFNFKLLAYYQKGKSSSFLDLSAYLTAIKISYKFFGSYAFIAGTDCYSGTKADADPSVTHSFDKLYGANHSVNGYMEYWRKIPQCGLIDYYGGLNLNFNRKLSIEATFHKFATAENFDVNLNKDGGSELDLVFNYIVNPEIKFQAGFCYYFTTITSNTVSGVTGSGIYSPMWSYLMVSIKPLFYKSSSKS